MRTGLIVSVLLLGLTSTWSQAAESCLAAGCHAEYATAAYPHAPAAEQDCAACHAVTDAVHPDEASFELVEPEPQLCLQCHDDPAADLVHTHSALEDGCTGCHDPHGGADPKFVVEAGGALCLVCHEEILEGQYLHAPAEGYFTGTTGGLELLKFGDFPEDEKVWPDMPGGDHKHGPVAAGSCLMCHTAHGGENTAMLKLPGNTLCLACHTGIKDIIDNAVSQHEPVANGNCWDCHTAHASDFKPFLRAYYPREFYVPYEDENFALCFNCHNKKAFIYERTSAATGFRNRDYNLHYFHVNRPDKGRVCKSCHGVHGADQERLLRSTTPNFGKWGIPLQWAQTENGATCYVGCHGPKQYDRLIRLSNQ